MDAVTLHITGMSCGHCLNAVRGALSKTPGVDIQSVRIGRADVTIDPAATTTDALVAAIKDAGFDAIATPAER